MFLLVTAIAVGLGLLFRYGAPGQAGDRLLARSLNLSARQHWFGRRFSRAHAWIYERTGGRLVGRWFGAPVMVIETKGRKSGQLRRTTIIYATDGDRWVVMPANAGDATTPAWWLNLQAAGVAEIVVGGRRRRVQGQEADGPERDRLLQLLLAVTPTVGEYQGFTSRKLPVVVLEPV